VEFDNQSSPTNKSDDEKFLIVIAPSRALFF
jgi:hypothetical protein